MKKFILSIALLLGLGGVSQQMTAQNLVPIPLKMQTVVQRGNNRLPRIIK